LQEGGIELGGEFGVPINPLFVDDLKAVDVTDPLLGTISVYDLIMTRIAQMSMPNVIFDPFSGPMNFKNGTQWLAAGETADIGTLLSIDWFVEGIIADIPT
ncbi:MAG: BMP family ABC transporter substrate-binding protein, partial [Candidatus Thorarchaeota archaeon]